ncbi:MAG TPA: hypothetical protein VF637_07470 [Sphingomicrobium sp.]|jgi:uncharacterized membrane protein
MRRTILLTIVPLLLAACRPTPVIGNSVMEQVREPLAADRQARWSLHEERGVAELRLARGTTVLIRLICEPSARRLLVNIPAFQPIGSEERLSVGGGDPALALVADISGDTVRGGVTGSGPFSADMFSGPEISASYGSQVSGPHDAPGQALSAAFSKTCHAKPGTTPAQPPVSSTASSACLRQDGAAVPGMALRAVGTEPFWGARIEGRCVTYSHPDDQTGTRVWTRFSGTAQAGQWTGSYGGKPFVLRTRPQEGCSDGMSDRRYPTAADLTVRGEERRGCAAPL